VEEPAREPAPPEPDAPEELDEETLTVLSAAVAAFLGKPAHIRRARLVSAPAPTAWVQQGRAYVQASHNLPTRQRA
jgi:methylmalonyl-CoA carboxyltransferase large subunit